MMEFRTNKGKNFLIKQKPTYPVPSYLSVCFSIRKNAQALLSLTAFSDQGSISFL